MKLCVAVPGICGSRLDMVNALGQRELWVNRILLAGGGVGYLALSPDGVTPPDSTWPTIVPNGPLDGFYSVTDTTFRRQLEAEGYELIIAGVDWRQSVLRTGARLASFILGVSAKYESIALVGHSQGGLICRRAYQLMAAEGQAGLVTRLITLGTPHRGSWEPAMLFSNITDQVPQLVLIAPNIVVPGGGLITLGILDAIKRIAATWPGLYELLVVAPVDPRSDPFIGQLYQASNWPAAWGLQQRWLDHTAGPFRAWITDESLLPPYEVLTTVAGTGRPTCTGWRTLDEIGDPDALRPSGDGDGVVLQASALLTNSKQYIVDTYHQAFPEHMATSGQLVAWVTEVRTPAPPPPAVVVPVGAPLILRGPPMPITQVYGVDP